MGICEVVGDGQLSYLPRSLLRSNLLSGAAPARCVDDEQSEDARGIPFFALLAVSEVRMDGSRPRTDGRVPQGERANQIYGVIN